MAEIRNAVLPRPRLAATGAVGGTQAAAWSGLPFHGIPSDFLGPSFGVPTRQGELRFERATSAAASDVGFNSQNTIRAVYEALIAGVPASDYVEDLATLVFGVPRAARNVARGSQSGWTIEVSAPQGEGIHGPLSSYESSFVVVGGYSYLTDSGSYSIVVDSSVAADDVLQFPRRILDIKDDWRRLHDEVQGFAKLHDGWDGDRGKSASQLTVDRARSALEVLARAEVVALPELAYSGDGELDFLWELGDAVASIGFFSDETVTIYAYEPKMNQPVQFEGRVYPANRIEELAFWLRNESGRPFAFRMD